VAGDAKPGRALSRWSRILQSISGTMEMPHEVILDIPRATLIGSMQVQIENHKGVLLYTPTCVRIATRDGAFVIAGSRLRIGSIYKDEVVVEGRIDRLDLFGSVSAEKGGSTVRRSSSGEGAWTQRRTPTRTVSPIDIKRDLQ